TIWFPLVWKKSGMPVGSLTVTSLMLRLGRTVTVALPLRPPAAACTVALPVPEGAVYRPVGLTDPMPLATVQGKAGCVARGLPNWSRALAVASCVPPGATLAR